MTSMYGSGLPADLGGTNSDRDFLLSQYGAQVVSRVNFDRERVRPSYSVDAAVGMELVQRDRRTLAVEAEAANLTNHLNVINFASLFSGTAIGISRSVSVQMKLRW
jgi:hypothetical protein